MTVTIPKELEQAIERRAAERRTSVENLVQEALHWYLQTDSELLDELTAWQEIRDEASAITEEA